MRGPGAGPPAPFALLDEAPTPAEFAALRAACGWGDVSEALAARALAGSLLDATARRGTELLGFGRVVGDGALYFYLQDVVVVAGARGRGVGRAIVGRLMARLRGLAPPGATVGLMAAKDAERFYRGFGFDERPSPSLGAGMTQLVG